MYLECRLCVPCVTKTYLASYEILLVRATKSFLRKHYPDYKDFNKINSGKYAGKNLDEGYDPVKGTYLAFKLKVDEKEGTRIIWFRQ